MYNITAQSTEDASLTANAVLVVLHIDIEQTNVYHSAMSTNAVTFNLTGDSYWGNDDDTVIWTGGPYNENLGTGTNISFTAYTNWPAGEHTITAYSSLRPECRDIATLTTLKVELDIWNGGGYLGIGDVVGCMPEDPVSQSEKYVVGAFLQVNWDNDDGSGTRNPDGSWADYPVPDLEKDYVENENNLAQLRPQVEPLPDDGTVTLKVTGPDKDKVKLWTESTKGTEIPLSSYSINWNLSNAGDRVALQDFMENSLWIEGIAPGTAQRGVTFSLSYSRDENIVCEDKVRATVVFMRLGSAVYRDLAIGAVAYLGHGGILYRFKEGVELTVDNMKDDANYQVLHSMRQDNGPTIDDFTNISAHPSASHWVGCFETAGLSYAQRLMILHEAIELYEYRGQIEYAGTGMSRVLVTTSGQENTWNGRYDDIVELRCDALIEVLYEKPGAYIGNVWGKRHDNVWRYAISTHAFLHNSQKLGPSSHSSAFNPATQSGNTTPTGETATQFERKTFIVEPGILY